MSSNGIVSSKQSRRIEEINGVYKENLVKEFADYFQNIGEKHEINPKSGNLFYDKLYAILYAFILYELTWIRCILIVYLHNLQYLVKYSCTVCRTYTSLNVTIVRCDVTCLCVRSTRVFVMHMSNGTLRIMRCLQCCPLFWICSTNCYMECEECCWYEVI